MNPMGPYSLWLGKDSGQLSGDGRIFWVLERVVSKSMVLASLGFERASILYFPV